MSSLGPFREEFEEARDPAAFATLTGEPEAGDWETEDVFEGEGEGEGEWYAPEPGEFAATLTAEPEAEDWMTEPLAAEEAVGKPSLLEDGAGELETPTLADLASAEEQESFFDEATEMIRNALDAIKTRVRIGNGIRDEQKLTSLVFFDRHPTRAGRALSPDEPHFTELRWEWLAIRDTIVRPALRPPAPSPSYDRDGAVAYARKFWLQPCDDRFIALGPAGGKTFVAIDPGTRFEHEFESDGTPKPREHAVLPDGSQIPWEHLDDCTHFISCCIGERPGERCGGLKITYRQLGAPPTAPYGIVRVSTMVGFLVRKGYAQVVAEKSEDDTMISRLQPGDLIAYFHKGRQIYSHLAMLLPDNKIACHTYGRSDQPECTWDNSWALGRGTHRWTFLRIVV